tara:strand:+ start:5546 stop:6628 length:1083 start_codon:yes stop_codon:yes gene_type:complete
MNIKKITIRHSFTFSALAILCSTAVYYCISNTDDTSHAASMMNNKPLISNESLQNNRTKKSTQNILGYESQYGALPHSLIGTTLDNALQVDTDGHLIISIDIKDLFDYFLSTISEENLETILLRINEYLTYHLQEPALSESKAILAQYIEFKYSLKNLEEDMSNELAKMSQQDKINGGYLNFLRTQIDQRNALRAQYLDLEVYETFYEDEQRYDEYTYSRLLVTSNTAMSETERLAKIKELQSTLPDDVRKSIRETQITDELTARTEKILASGGDQQQVRELRREMFGDEAVQRFDELDQQRAQWNARVSAYLAQRSNILSSQGLTRDELNSQVDTLRAALFDEREQIRVRSIERHTKAS